MENFLIKKSDLFSSFLVSVLGLLVLLSLFTFCLFTNAHFQNSLNEIQLVQLRTTFYVIAIITLPITNLLRHIFLRLNQTMPVLNSNIEQIAKKRYLLTNCVSVFCVSFIAALAVTLFMLGDKINSFYILMFVSVLGLFLYHPKVTEYEHILHCLDAQTKKN